MAKKTARKQAEKVKEVEGIDEVKEVEEVEDTEDFPGTRTMSVGINRARWSLFKGLTALSNKLSCRVSDLVFYALETMLENPPVKAPIGARPPSGSAAGFWLVASTDEKTGQAKKVSIVEVEARGELSEGGWMFFRYDRNSAKSRERAKIQAGQAAAFNIRACGIREPLEWNIYEDDAENGEVEE